MHCMALASAFKNLASAFKNLKLASVTFTPPNNYEVQRRTEQKTK